VVREMRPIPRMNGGMITLDIEVVNQKEEIVQRGVWTILVKNKA